MMKTPFISAFDVHCAKSFPGKVMVIQRVSLVTNDGERCFDGSLNYLKGRLRSELTREGAT